MNLVDIANRAGVSTATVSKVINNYPSVSRAMVERVRDVMREMEVEPSSRRRPSRALNLPVAVLVLHANQFHAYTSTFQFMLSGVESSLRARGIDMVLAHVTKAEDMPAVVTSRQVRGLILVGHHPDEDIVRLLEDLPAVWLTSHHAATGDVLLSGNEAVGRLAANYLVGRGHRCVATLDVIRNPVSELRRQFFEFIAAGHGATVSHYVGEDVEDLFQDQPALDLARLEAQVTPLVDRLLADPQRATGLFVPFDMQAAMVYRVLARRGIRPGADLDIVGSDDERAALIGLYPRPATINIGPATMGRRAVEQLFLRIENQREDERRVRMLVEPELVPGD